MSKSKAPGATLCVRCPEAGLGGTPTRALTARTGTRGTTRSLTLEPPDATEFVEDGKAERVGEFHGEHYAELQERGHPLPGAKELVASLVERGYEVWLATSAEPEELEHHLHELGAEDNIAGIVSSDEAEESKPAPDIFGLALERAGVSPEAAVVVGDSIWDLEAAKEAGVRAAAVMTGGAFSRAELEEAGAYAVYKDCHELLDDDFPEERNPTRS